MTDWEAVFTGVAVGTIINILIIPLGLGYDGFVGGCVTGYLANDGMIGGGGHGLVTGVVVGIIASVFVFIAAILFGAAMSTSQTAGQASITGTFLFVTPVVAFQSTVGGMIGGSLASATTKWRENR